MSINKNHLIEIFADACAGMPCMCREAMFLDKQPTRKFFADMWPEPCALCAGVLHPETYREYGVMRMIESGVHITINDACTPKSNMRVYTVQNGNTFYARVYCCNGIVLVDPYSVTDYVQTGIEAAVIGAILKTNGKPVTYATDIHIAHTLHDIGAMVHTRAFAVLAAFGGGPVTIDDMDVVCETTCEEDMAAMCEKLGVYRIRGCMSHLQIYDKYVFDIDVVSEFDPAEGELRCEKMGHIAHRFVLPHWYDVASAIARWKKRTDDTRMYVTPDPDNIDRLYIRFMDRATTAKMRSTSIGCKILAQIDDLAAHISGTAWRVARNHFDKLWYGDIIRAIDCTINHPPPRDAIAK